MEKLKLDWTNLTMDPRWYDFESGEMVKSPEGKEGVFLLIQPYPAELAKVVLRDDGLVISGEEQKAIFSHCLVNWHNVTGANDEPLECNDEVKEKVFQFQMAGIPNFVITKSREYDLEKKAQEKN